MSQANTEHNAVYAKMQPFLPELRKRSGRHRATLANAAPTKEVQ